MKNGKLGIFIADDHSVVRMGLKTIVSYQKDMTVVGEARDGQAAVDGVLANRPDVVIMDLMMPLKTGAEATREILAAAPDTKVIILTSFGTSEELRRALDNGACGTLLKDSDNDELLTVIRAVARGAKYVPDEIAKMIAEQEPSVSLSDRQTDLLYACMRGLNTQDMATQLGISQHGVKKHFETIFAKLGASTRAEAVAIALRDRLIQPVRT